MNFGNENNVETEMRGVVKKQRKDKADISARTSTKPSSAIVLTQTGLGKDFLHNNNDS